MANKPIEWHTEKRKLRDLRPMEGNPRQATEKQVADLTKSLERFNLAAPIIINTDNTIIGGHFRYRILNRGGKKNQGREVDVRVPSRKLTKKEAEELNLRLNKNLGEWDLDLLIGMDADLLKTAGFGEDEFPLCDMRIEEKEIDEEDLEYEHKCPRCGYEW